MSKFGFYVVGCVKSGRLLAVSVEVHGQRQDSPPKLTSIDYKIIVDTDENDHKLALLHKNIQKFGTIYNTVSSATELSGVIVKKQA